MDRTFTRARGPLKGTLRVPGDKSISHRAVLFSAMAEGTSTLDGVLDSADVRSTIGVVSALGAEVRLSSSPSGALEGEVRGWGSKGPSAPAAPVDCGNSGTTARLTMGVLAGWPVEVTFEGDASLSRRPMRRVMEPLESMGAAFESHEGGTLPLTLIGSDQLQPIDYRSPVASAQVKSAVLLAGTRAGGRTRIWEPSRSRDHTERLLPAFGVEVDVEPSDKCAVSVRGPVVLSASRVSVPGDPSSAAFIIAGAVMVAGSEVAIEGVSVNPTRAGFVEVLARMGADILVREGDMQGSEPVGDITVRFAEGLSSTLVEAGEVASLIDEVPVLALVATQAAGTTRFEGIGELRVKESDRLSAVESGLQRLGAQVRTGKDWLEIDGPVALGEARLESLGDHRLAMCWALAGLVGEVVTVVDYGCVDVSYPAFADDLNALGA